MSKAQAIDPPKLVVTVIIVLLVLVVMLFIFGKESGSFLSFLDAGRQEILQNKCEGILLGRRCLDPAGANTPTSEPGGTCPDGFNCVPAIPPAGEESYQCSGNEVCYELRRI